MLSVLENYAQLSVHKVVFLSFIPFFDNGIELILKKLVLVSQGIVILISKCLLSNFQRGLKLFNLVLEVFVVSQKIVKLGSLGLSFQLEVVVVLFRDVTSLSLT